MFEQLADFSQILGQFILVVILAVGVAISFLTYPIAVFSLGRKNGFLQAWIGLTMVYGLWWFFGGKLLEALL